MCNIFAPNLLQRKLSQLPAQRSHPQGNGGQVHLMAFSRFLHFPRMNLNPAAVPAMHIFSAALTRFPVHASLFSPLFMSTFVHVHLCSCPPVFLFDRLCLQAPCTCIKPLWPYCRLFAVCWQRIMTYCCWTSMRIPTPVSDWHPNDHKDHHETQTQSLQTPPLDNKAVWA